MTPTTSAPEMVVYPGGLAVLRSAVELLHDLERRGVDLRIDTADDAVVCRPGRLLTHDDKRAITALRASLKVLIEYCGVVH